MEDSDVVFSSDNCERPMLYHTDVYWNPLLQSSHCHSQILYVIEFLPTIGHQAINLPHLPRRCSQQPSRINSSSPFLFAKPQVPEGEQAIDSHQLSVRALASPKPLQDLESQHQHSLREKPRTWQFVHNSRTPMSTRCPPLQSETFSVRGIANPGWLFTA